MWAILTDRLDRVLTWAALLTVLTGTYLYLEDAHDELTAARSAMRAYAAEAAEREDGLREEHLSLHNMLADMNFRLGSVDCGGYH